MPVYGLENRNDHNTSISNTIATNKTDTVENTVSAEDSLKTRQTNLVKQELRKEKRKALIGLAVIGTVFLFWGVVYLIFSPASGLN
jgi:hypothetical protein